MRLPRISTELNSTKPPPKTDIRNTHTHTLTIEAHVLSERLGEQDVVSLLDEVPDGPGVPVNVPTGKALIGHVKEHQQLPLLQGGEESYYTFRILILIEL